MYLYQHVRILFIGVKVKRDVFSETEEHKTVFVQNDLSFTIMCRAEVALSYCWFLHPNGSQFSPVARADQDQQFWWVCFLIFFFFSYLSGG